MIPTADSEQVDQEIRFAKHTRLLWHREVRRYPILDQFVDAVARPFSNELILSLLRWFHHFRAVHKNKCITMYKNIIVSRIDTAVRVIFFLIRLASCARSRKVSCTKNIRSTSVHTNNTPAHHNIPCTHSQAHNTLQYGNATEKTYNTSINNA